MLTNISKKNKNSSEDNKSLRFKSPKNKAVEEMPFLIENVINKNHVDEVEIKPQRLYRFRSYSKTQNLYVIKSNQRL